MEKQNMETSAQFIDKYLQRTAIGVSLIVVAFSLSAAEYFVSEPLARVFIFVTLGLGILAIIVVLPVFIRFVRLRSAGQCDTEGYVAEVFQKASARAFELTFVFLLFLHIVSNGLLADLPPKVLIEITLSVSLGIFCVRFFTLNRTELDLGDDEDFGSDTGS